MLPKIFLYLSNSFSKIKMPIEKDLTHKWIDAIIWKFCDLDKEPHDR